MVVRAIGEYEGPRTPTAEEWPRVLALLRPLFLSLQSEVEQGLYLWPMRLRADMRRGSLAIFNAGRPVSAILRFDRAMLIRGHRLSVAFMGAVGTDPDHRGKGLASTILAAMANRCAADGVDFIYISGTQGLYSGAGADHVGAEERFVVPDDLPHSDDVAVRPATAADAVAIARIAQGESTRFLRPLEDFAVVIDGGHCAGRAAAFHLVSQRGRAVAYAMLQGEAGAEEVVEVAGERDLALRGIAALGERLGRPLPVRLPRGDALGGLLRAEGVPGEVVTSDGTVKLVSFAATMARLRPYLREMMPDLDVAGLDAADAGGRFVAWSGAGVLQCDDERSALWAMAGCPPGRDAHVTATGALATLRERCLPLPLPSFVLNMI